MSHVTNMNESCHTLEYCWWWSTYNEVWVKCNVLWGLGFGV